MPSPFTSARIHELIDELDRAESAADGPRRRGLLNQLREEVKQQESLGQAATDRVREGAHDPSLALLRAISDSSSDAIFAKDRQGRLTFANPVTLALIGLPLRDVLGQTDVEFLFDKVAAQQVMANDEKIMASGIAEDFEETFRTPDGIQRVWVSRKVPYRDAQGVVIGLLGVGRDVSAPKRAIDEARAARQQLEIVIGSITDGVLMMDREWRYTFVSDQAARMVGVRREEILGQVVWDLHPHAKGTKIHKLFHEAVISRQPCHFEEFYPDPINKWLECHGYPSKEGLSVYLRDISDRKAAEQALREQGELLRGIIDGIPVMLTIYDSRMQSFRFNREMRAVLGWTEEDANQGDFVAMVYPDPGYRAEVVAYMQSLQSGWRDFELTAKDGTKVLSSWANIRLRDDTQIGIGIDIRQRMAAEEALRNSQQEIRHNEQRYRSIVEATAQIVWSSDARGESVLDTPAWQAFTGQSAAEARGYGWLDAIHPEDHDHVRRAWAQAHATGGIFETEYRLRRYDGVWRNIRSRGVPVGAGDGEKREYVGTCVDITERNQAEAARRESEIRLRLTTDALPVLISYVDAEQRYRFTNAAYFEWFGFSPPAGAAIGDVVGAPTYAARLPYIQRALSGEAVVFEDSMPHHVKGSRDTETSYVPDLADDGKTVRGFIALVYDITERRQAEVALRQAKQQAEQASEAKDQFLAVLSHELRTPLTPVLATAQMLESEPTLTPEHREMAQMIRRNIELEARLIDDLLDLTGIARNKLELRIASIDVHEKIRHVLRMCDEEIGAKQLAVTTELFATVHHVQADPARFQQIIWNLFKNAVKFTPAAGRITVRTGNPAEGRLSIEVVDTGLGIDATALPRIFDAFEQGGREVTRQFGGLGLGLAITKALVDMHGGTIAVVSEGRGKGAGFTVTFPATLPVVAATAGGAARVAPALSRTVLLVEDHVDTRQIMTRLLKRFGCVVVSAGTVAEALESATTQTFDVLISDVGLPDGSGTDLMRELKAKYGLRGIALSGFGMEDDLARSKEAGFEAHLTKPVNVHALEEAVRRVAQ